MLIKQSNLVLSLISALLVGFSYPPFHGFLSWIAFVPLIIIWHRENPKKSFLYSYLFGFLSKEEKDLFIDILNIKGIGS